VPYSSFCKAEFAILPQVSGLILAIRKPASKTRYPFSNSSVPISARAAHTLDVCLIGDPKEE
jgi:hypothetical protein